MQPPLTHINHQMAMVCPLPPGHSLDHFLEAHLNPMVYLLPPGRSLDHLEAIPFLRPLEVAIWHLRIRCQLLRALHRCMAMIRRKRGVGSRLVVTLMSILEFR